MNEFWAVIKQMAETAPVCFCEVSNVNSLVVKSVLRGYGCFKVDLQLLFKVTKHILNLCKENNLFYFGKIFNHDTLLV